MLKRVLFRSVARLFDLCGFEPRRRQSEFPRDYDAAAIETIRLVRPYTMTCHEKTFCLISAVRYVVENDIPGDFVECGVFRGGSVMAMARTLLELGATERKIYLYDTFAGMPQPTAADISSSGKVATDVFEQTRIDQDSSEWVNASLEEVRNDVKKVPYPFEKFVFVKGKVEATLPELRPSAIALLRLDTDLYSSTKAELEWFFPLLEKGGVVIFDDYGHWLGSRKAIDEYFSQQKTRILLNRIDFSGRVAIKQ